MDVTTSERRKVLFNENGGYSQQEASCSQHIANNKSFKRENVAKRSSVIFGLREEVGILARTLKVFEEKGLNLTQIESRPSKRMPGSYEFLVTCEAPPTELEATLNILKEQVTYHYVLPRSDESKQITVPWFPRKIRDLDEIATHILNTEGEIKSDHPGLTDPVYRKRRNQLVDIASKYRHGEPIPRVTYTEIEIKTWNTVFTQLTDLYKTHACKEYNSNFDLFVENNVYGPDNIPQLQDVSNFLKDRTGFTLRPGGGQLTPRDHIAGLAFRVHYTTQYIRHPDRPMYNFEPDICHELLGHVPMYADPHFAQFAQEIGLLSLGASDEQIKKLSKCFWFTVEFGLCRQHGQIKAYGAGLLSSYGELKYCLSDEPEIRSFDTEKASVTQFPFRKFQPVYYLAESFEDAKEKLRDWARRIERPFSVHYNPYTQSVEVMDQKKHLEHIVTNITR